MLVRAWALTGGPHQVRLLQRLKHTRREVVKHAKKHQMVEKKAAMRQYQVMRMDGTDILVKHLAGKWCDEDDWKTNGQEGGEAVGCRKPGPFEE